MTVEKKKATQDNIAGAKENLKKGTREIKVGHKTKLTPSGEGAVVPLTDNQIFNKERSIWRQEKALRKRG